MADGTLKVGTITTSSGSGTITLGQSGETVNAGTGVLSRLGVFESQLLHVRDEKDVTAHGGTAQAGANVRNLNTIKTNEITGASLSSNQITLPTGTYYINASAPAWQVAYNHVYLYNTTDSSVIIYGYNNYVNPTDGYGRSHVHGRFTLASQKVLELRQWMNNTKTHGLGLYSLNTEPSVYAEVEIWRTA